MQCVYKHQKAGQGSEENMYCDDYNKSKKQAMEVNLEEYLLADDVSCMMYPWDASYRSSSSYTCTCSIKERIQVLR